MLKAIGAYVVCDLVGSGGYAFVYRVRRPGSDEDLALKLLRPEAVVGTGTSRFLREVETLRRLDHPAIVRIIDSGVHDGTPYLVMPLVRGRTLQDLLTEAAPLDLRLARDMADAIGAALASAHAAGVVHRDVTPSNILFDGARWYLADFGLSLGLEGDVDRLTSSSVVIGTSEFMSPEQVAGARQIGAASDQYSFACVLYFALAGVPPFRGPSPQATRAMRLAATPPPIRALRPGAPPAADAAVLRALSREPADRFRSMEDFLRALDAPQPRNRRGPIAALAGVSLLVAAGVIALKQGPPRRAEESAPPRPALTIHVATMPDSADGAAAQMAAGSMERLGADIPGIKITAAAEPIPPTEQASSPDYRITLSFDQRDALLRLRAELVVPSTFEAVGTYQSPVDSLPAVEAVARRLLIDILRTLATRDGDRIGESRMALLSLRAPDAVTATLRAQRLFGQDDAIGALDALAEAKRHEGDSPFIAARIAHALIWQHHYEQAAQVAGDALATGVSGRAQRELLEGALAFARGASRNAVARYTQAANDDPLNIDAWYGLGEAALHLGWLHGAPPSSALSPLKRVATLAPAFAPVHHHLVDLLFAQGDTAGAAHYLALIAPGDPSRRSRELALALDTRPRNERSLSDQLRAEPRLVLSELVVLHGRRTGNIPFADSIARVLANADRPLPDRLRGMQYRLALGPQLGRQDEALRDLLALASGLDTQDPWLSVYVLAGFAPHSLLESQIRASKAHLAAASRTAFDSPADSAWHSAELLVGCALTAAALCPTAESRALVETGANKASPNLLQHWRASLEAAEALVRNDSTAALAALMRSLVGVQETFTAYHPWAGYPLQRLVAARLACRLRSDEAKHLVESFRFSDAVIDAMLLPIVAVCNSSTT